jgi:predicted PurR-regulated permease PerM
MKEEINIKELKTTNRLLLVIVIPLIFYLLKLLSFIFIPLILSMFIALLLTPIMRLLLMIKVPKPISVFIVVLVVLGFLRLGGELVQLSSNEILSSDSQFFEKAETKLVDLVVSIEEVFKIERSENVGVIEHYFKSDNVLESFGSTFNFIKQTISMTLMTAFFVVLLLSESINFERMMSSTIFDNKYSSIKTFIKIEKDIIKFVKVKFLVSLFTGIGFSLACLYFDVSFPIFWGLFAFLINFVQMIGSVISVVVLSLFAFVELDPTSTLLFFILAITLVQAIMGGILEPIFMGKTFSLNIITVLVMLMLWGYIWGVPGLIMSIPITVVIKIILEQFPNTRVIAGLMSGHGAERNYPWKKKVS